MTYWFISFFAFQNGSFVPENNVLKLTNSNFPIKKIQKHFEQIYRVQKIKIQYFCKISEEMYNEFMQ